MLSGLPFKLSFYARIIVFMVYFFVLIWCQVFLKCSFCNFIARVFLDFQVQKAYKFKKVKSWISIDEVSGLIPPWDTQNFLCNPRVHLAFGSRSRTCNLYSFFSTLLHGVSMEILYFFLIFQVFSLPSALEPFYDFQSLSQTK